jgi:hypothetical protein
MSNLFEDAFRGESILFNICHLELVLELSEKDYRKKLTSDPESMRKY